MSNETPHIADKAQIVREVADKVYEHLDPNRYGWAAGDGPTPEGVIEALFDLGALHLPAEEAPDAEEAHMEMCGSVALADGRVVPGCHIETDPTADKAQPSEAAIRATYDMRGEYNTRSYEAFRSGLLEAWHTERGGDKATTGMERRYYVKRLNDAAHKHDECQFFVLDPEHDSHAVAALRAYAASTGGRLALEITAWLKSLGYCPRRSQAEGHRGACGTRSTPAGGDA